MFAGFFAGRNGGVIAGLLTASFFRPRRRSLLRPIFVAIFVVVVVVVVIVSLSTRLMGRPVAVALCGSRLVSFVNFRHVRS